MQQTEDLFENGTPEPQPESVPPIPAFDEIVIRKDGAFGIVCPDDGIEYHIYNQPDQHNRYPYRSVKAYAEANPSLCVPEPDPTPTEILAVKLRSWDQSIKRAFQDRSDPIMAQYLRGDATKEEWLAEVEAVKQDYPKPAMS